MGKLFVIDGTDGSGKQTQSLMLKKRFDEEKINYMQISFPNYNSPSSSLVKMYLSGDFGEHPDDVSPYIASTFYAADRYTTSNMIHQAGKIKNKEERKKFIEWLFDLEFNLYKIPKPDKVFFLNMPPKDSINLIKNRNNKFTKTAQKDIHERDEHYMLESYNAACDLAKEYNWNEINCIKEGKIRALEDIHEEIYKAIKKEIE